MLTSFYFLHTLSFSLLSLCCLFVVSFQRCFEFCSIILILYTVLYCFATFLLFFSYSASICYFQFPTIMEVSTEQLHSLLLHRMILCFADRNQLQPSQSLQDFSSLFALNDDKFLDVVNRMFSKYSCESILNKILDKKTVSPALTQIMNDAKEQLLHELSKVKSSIYASLSEIEKKIVLIFSTDFADRLLDDFEDGMLNEDDVFKDRIISILKALSTSITSEECATTKDNIETITSLITASHKSINEEIKQLSEKIFSICAHPKDVQLLAILSPTKNMVTSVSIDIKNTRLAAIDYFGCTNVYSLDDIQNNTNILYTNPGGTQKIMNGCILATDGEFISIQHKFNKLEALFISNDNVGKQTELFYNQKWGKMTCAQQIRTNKFGILFENGSFIKYTLPSLNKKEHCLNMKFSDYTAFCIQDKNKYFFSNNGDIEMWTFGSSQSFQIFYKHAHKHTITVLKMSKNAKWLLSGANDDKIQLFDVGLKSQVWEKNLGGFIVDAFLIQMDSFVVALSKNQNIYVLSAKDGQIVMKKRIEILAPFCMSVMWEEKKIVAGNSSGDLLVSEFVL